MQKIIKKFKNIWWALKLLVIRIRLGNPSKKLKVIGVTGTNGKTTTVTLLHNITNALGYKSGLISTVEILIGQEKLQLDSKKPIPATTPDSVLLTKIFSKMLKAGRQYVFMEVSSHALDQHRVSGVDFDGGIFTNLTHDHLDYHKDFKNYFIAKRKFFEMLPAKAFALSNNDDDHGKIIVDDIKARKYFYGFGSEEMNTDFQGEICELNFSGLSMLFNGEEIKSKLLGKFNAYNLLAVWSACKLLDFDMVKVKKILEDIKPPKGRFEHFQLKTGATAIFDYAHTPDALEKVLLTVQEIRKPGSRIISVFGCGGDRDTSKRPEMGQIGARFSDIAIFTSDNPRSEDPEKIIDQMQDNLSEDESVKVITIADRRLAIQEAIRLADQNDIILCAGKGHEDYQEIKGEKKHFDDKEELQRTI